MLDRLAFLASRGLGPLGNLAILFVVGLAFGKGAIGDYTYALAICSPVYFIVTFSLPTYIAVEPAGTTNRPEIFWVRVSTLAASLVPAVLLAFSADPKWAATGALWILKSGDVLFDPVIAFTATDGASARRGWKLVRMEGIRLFVVQLILASSALVFRGNLPLSLALAGTGHIIVSTTFLLRVRWSSLKCDFRSTVEAARRIAATSAPMTLSGVILALLIGLPRILLDQSLHPDERTLVGLAQVAGSVMALLFNAGWMYELAALKRSAESGDLGKLFRHNLKLSLIYLAVLSGATLVILGAPTGVLTKFGIPQQGAVLLGATLFVLGLPHCASVHRDVLKLVRRQWAEVWILILALGASLLAWAVTVHIYQWRWFPVLVSMVVATILVQLVGATIVLVREFRDRTHSNLQGN